MSKNKGTNDTKTGKRKLGFLSMLLGEHRKKEWFILQKGKRSEGPFCLKELREKHSGSSLGAGLKIRKGPKGDWLSWVNAIDAYPALEYTGITISRKKSTDTNQIQKDNRDHELKKKKAIELVNEASELLTNGNAFASREVAKSAIATDPKLAGGYDILGLANAKLAIFAGKMGVVEGELGAKSYDAQAVDAFRYAARLGSKSARSQLESWNEEW